MMGVITALKTNPRRPSTVDVYIDGRRKATLPTAVAVDLAVGMSLDAAELDSLHVQASEAEAMNKAGRMLARRPHSEREVRVRLGRSGFEPAVIDRTVVRLVESEALDDRAFAHAWVENRMTFRPRSAAMIRSELRGKGVAAEAIEEALATVDERQAAQAAADRALRKLSGLEPPERQRRLYEYLVRRGFAHETIRAVVRSIESSTAESESEGTE